ncbi:ankyrin repeat domain-containing protein [Psychrosphaera aestuarii]|uniref:ankyrin repeat domain-containing protein n=1 Tax=Psychrosphaera aestuarii TaxID=1266052 RepID=UPI001B32B36E|nr:ankyrin repeat domain-containing protein [Psychrosphaera aestuarii]
MRLCLILLYLTTFSFITCAKSETPLSELASHIRLPYQKGEHVSPSELKLYELQIKMIGESFKSKEPLCYNYDEPYQKIQKELAILVAKSAVSDSKYILEAAVMADSFSDVKRLVEAGAPFITRRLSWGASLLHIAAIHSSPKVINYLHSQGIDVNIKIEDTGVTPLHLAVNSNKTMNIVALVELGADVNAKDDQGSVPIINTFGCKDIDTFNYLLKKGTKIYPKVIEVADKIGANIES